MQLDSQTLVIGLLVLALVAVVVYLVCQYCKSSTTNVNVEPYAEYSNEMLSTEDNPQEQGLGESSIAQPPSAAEPLGQNESPQTLEETEDSLSKASVPKDCFPKDQLTPQDLLPSDTNSTWAQVNPAGQGNIGDNNLLTAGHHVGINTVGQTLRNANLQLRSEPPNPQMKVSPWMQSTIEPDTNRRAMEIN